MRYSKAILLAVAVAPQALSAAPDAPRTLPVSPERLAEFAKQLGKRIDPASPKTAVSVAAPITADARLTLQQLEIYEPSSNSAQLLQSGSIAYAYRYQNGVDYVVDCAVDIPSGKRQIVVGTGAGASTASVTDGHALIVNAAIKTGGGGFRTMFISPAPATTLVFHGCEIRVVK